jgi:hypothetical protein
VYADDEVPVTTTPEIRIDQYGSRCIVIVTTHLIDQSQRFS